MNQKLLKYVWFMTHKKPIKNSAIPKSIKTEESAEEKFNEFQNMRSSPFRSLFSRQLRK